MNQYTLDGVALRDPQLKWYTDRSTGVRVIPARRVPEQRFPGVDGQIHITDQPYDAGAVSMRIRVTGRDWDDMRINLEFLTALITQRSKLMELREHFKSSSYDDRVAMVTLAGSVEPVITSKRTSYIDVIFSIPGTFWRSANDILANITEAITTTPTTRELTAWRGGNAPIDDMLIRVAGGAFSSLVLTDEATGNELRVNTAITSSQRLLIDPVNWKAVIQSNTGDVWTTTTGTDVSGLVVPNRGYGSMFLMEPILDTQSRLSTYRVRVSGTNISGTPRVTMRAKRSYL